MGLIPQSQIVAAFWQAFTAAINERIPPVMFLQTFFPNKTYKSKEIHLLIRRGTEKVAVDIISGTGGRRNKFSLSTQKGLKPPSFDEYIDLTESEDYEVIFGVSSSEIPSDVAARAVKNLIEEIIILEDKIDRAKERMIAQFMDTGVVLLKNGDNIDYKRKAASFADYSVSDPWTAITADIGGQIATGCKFVRNEGKNSTGEFNMIMSGGVFTYMENSNFFQNKANLRNAKLVDFDFPQKNGFNGTLHGIISVENYIIYVWTYEEVYETDDEVITNYLDKTQIQLIPTTGTDWEFSHAAIPAAKEDGGRPVIGLVEAEKYKWDFVDPKKKVHEMHVESKPVPFPKKVDQIATIKVIPTV